MAQTTKTATARAATKTYIDVAYKDRDLAKRLGARWDASVKRWYCPSGSTLALIYKWRKAPTPAELAPDAVAPAKAKVTLSPLELAVAAAKSTEAAKTSAKTPTTTKIRSARITRMPARKASATPAPDLFASLELPLAG